MPRPTHPYEILNLVPKPITAVEPTRWFCAKRCYGIVDLRRSSARGDWSGSGFVTEMVVGNAPVPWQTRNAIASACSQAAWKFEVRTGAAFNTSSPSESITDTAYC